MSLRTLEGICLWAILPAVLLVNSQLLNKTGCGESSSCFSKPAGCTSSDDCNYLLKYTVTAQNVVFELGSNKYQWVAVGFNSHPGMAGGKSLACETHKSHVVLRHYDMPRAWRPKLSANSNATLLNSKVEGNVLYCKIERKLEVGPDRYNLNNPVYILHAAGDMETDGVRIASHHIAEHSPNLVSVLDARSDNTDNSKAKKRIDTTSCENTFGCARMPSSCHDNTDCDYLIVFKKNGTNVEFSVSGKADGWIAVGFNDKPRMGGTDSIICQTRGGNISLWVANLEYESPDLFDSSEISLLDAKYEGGIIYCKFTRPLKFAKDNKRVSIDVSRYLIYAKGSGSSSLNEHKDGDYGCSSVKVEFGKNVLYELGHCDTGELAKVHGSFMLFAWMFLVIISIFIARYSRSLWKNWMILGKHAWFQFHRWIMGLAVLFTIISIIIIFVAKEGWSESAGDHAIFGIIVLVLAVVQPTIAFFRPQLGHPRRPVFNWFHRFVAVILVITSVIAVFKGTELLESSGGDTSSKLVIVLIVLAVVTALILEYLAFRLRKKPTTALISEEVQEGKAELWELRLQRVLVVVFALVAFILAVAMIALVAGGDDDDDDDDD